jgi:transposase
MEPGLQMIIGVDKRNPVFSIYRNDQTKEVYLFYGAALLEIIEDRPDNPQLKIMLAQMYNAGVKVKSLIEYFGFSYPTYRRWGKALKSGSAEELVKALSGQGGPSKLTTQVKSFVCFRFWDVYQYNKYSYSKEIREEIERVFGITLSSESLRPIFNKLKEQWPVVKDLPYEKKRTYCFDL